MKEGISHNNAEEQIYQDRNKRVLEAISSNMHLRYISEKRKVDIAQSLMSVALSIENRYSGRWNSVRWGSAWIEMQEDEDKTLIDALLFCREEVLIKSFRDLFQMYEASVTTMEALRAYKELAKIKAPQYPRRTVASPLRKAKRNRYPIE